MEITYYLTYRDMYRVKFYNLTSLRNILSKIVLPIVFITLSIANQFRQMNWLQFPIAALIASFSWFIVLPLIMHILILYRFLTLLNMRKWMAKITPVGLEDISLSKSYEIPWSAISEIRTHQGDIYFWQKRKNYNVIPRSAFENREQSQLFYEEALRYWNAAKNGQFFGQSKDETVWPPAPHRMG